MLTKPLQVGFYKFIEITGLTASAEYRSSLKAGSEKTSVQISISPLFHPQSTYSGFNHSLVKKVIKVEKVYSLTSDDTANYADWSVLDRNRLEQLTNADNPMIRMNDLSVEDRLRVYDIVKADPTIQLIDDDGTGNDIPDGDANFSDWPDGE